MKKITLLSLIVGLNLIAQTTFAEFSNAKCSRMLTHSGDVQIQRDYDAESRVCFISIHPMSAIDLKYRDYYFNNQGLFLVFNSYGEGSDASSTGARVFYTLPVVNDYPDFSIEANGDVVIKTSSGHLVAFDSKKLAIKSFAPGFVTEKPLSSGNKGGVEIRLTEGVWFDSGFRMGGMANERPSGSTIINGSVAGQCTVKNSEIFDYSNDIVPKYAGTNLTSFLKKRCPQLKF